MAEDYIRIYQQLLSRSSTQAAAWSCFLQSRRGPVALDGARLPPTVGLSLTAAGLLDGRHRDV